MEGRQELWVNKDFYRLQKEKKKHNRKRMPLGKVKRMEKAFQGLNKKDNIYLCRRTVGHRILGPKRLVVLRTLKSKETVPNQRAPTFSKNFL